MTTPSRCSMHCIIPPHMMKKMIESGDANARNCALDTLIADAGFRGTRELRAMRGDLTAPTSGRRAIYDARNSFDVNSATLIRSEGDAEVADDAINRVYDGFGLTRDFLLDVFDRNSLDGQGHRLEGYVHVGHNYNNATWDGQVMRFGDGDGIRFTDFTQSLDVIAHELAHGLTTHTANLIYERESGALNESMSDVIGAMVKQWALEQTVEDADWLIGADIFTPGIGMDALRSLSHPGEAYNNALFGKDPQPADYESRYQGPEDNYGVHINSGIPNKAFFTTAMMLGGHSWEVVGHIWYATLLASNKFTEIHEFADRTYLMAGQYGAEAQAAVVEGWEEVKVRIKGASSKSRFRRNAHRMAEKATNGTTLKQFSTQIEKLAKQVASLSEDVQTLKKSKKRAKEDA